MVRRGNYALFCESFGALRLAAHQIFTLFLRAYLNFLAEELRHVAEFFVAGIQQLIQRHLLQFG